MFYGLLGDYWCTNFRALISLVHSQKYPHDPHIILGPHKYFSHIIQIFSMTLGSHKFFLYKTHINISHIYYPNILLVIRPSQILLTQAHKLSWALSQILPIISHISSNLNSPQIMLIISLPKLSRKITLSPHKAQHHLACGQNSKKAQIPKVPLRCG